MVHVHFTARACKHFLGGSTTFSLNSQWCSPVSYFLEEQFDQKAILDEGGRYIPNTGKITLPTHVKVFPLLMAKGIAAFFGGGDSGDPQEITQKILQQHCFDTSFSNQELLFFSLRIQSVLLEVI